MAGGEVIGAAIGVLLLIIVGYVLVGSTLTTAEVVVSAQKDISIQNEARLQTAINLTNFRYTDPLLKFNITNTGNVMIGNFEYLDVYITPSGADPMYHSFTVSGIGVAGISWNCTGISPDIIHKNMLDPGETMEVQILGFTPKPVSVSVSMPNGITDFSYIP